MSNARLIAAAPELLDAMKAIVAVCPECHGANDFTVHGEHVECPWCESARAAIAKATGGAK
jgi:Zn finger protein HypA/HybF involved in hydrogenase expression